MRDSNTENLGTVKIVTLGSSEEEVVTITHDQMTVEEVFNAAEMAFPTDREVFCNGVKAHSNSQVDSGDVFQIVKNKVEAGM